MTGTPPRPGQSADGHLIRFGPWTAMADGNPVMARWARRPGKDARRRAAARKSKTTPIGN